MTPPQTSSPSPSPYTLPALGWRPRPYQMNLWNYRRAGGKRAAICWHRRCLAAGTNISMADGTFKKIEDVKKGDKIISFDGVNFVNDEVVNSWFAGQKKCITINSNITCTKDHRFLNASFKWQEINNSSNVIKQSKYNKLISENIKSKTNAGLLPTYDLEIKNNHNFIANGYIVHNSGKDLFCINEIAYCACPPEGSHPTARIGLYWHILPTFNQGRKVIWEGITNDGKKFIDHFPPAFIKGEGGINNQEMRISFNNGSTYQVLGGDDPDRLVGSNPVGIVISEYSIIPEKTWHYLMPILNANDGWAIFIFTPRGENHAYQMINQAKTNPKWFSEILTVDNTFRIKEDGTRVPIVSKEDIEEDRKNGMDEATIQQEYYGSFKASLSGSYYGEYMDKADADGRITNVPHEPLLPVFSSWDLGINDQTVITLFQTSPAGEIRIIDCVSGSGEGFAYYLRRIREKPYNYATHFFPWDMAIREGSSGMSRLDTIRSMGLRNCQIVPKLSVEDGIEAVRNILPKCWFDKTKCSELIKALKSYHKDYNEALKTFKSSPVHDWSSDFADSFRYLAISQKRFKSHSSASLPQTAFKRYSII